MSLGLVDGRDLLVPLRNSIRSLAEIHRSFNQKHNLPVHLHMYYVDEDSNDAFDILGEIIVDVYGTAH